MQKVLNNNNYTMIRHIAIFTILFSSNRGILHNIMSKKFKLGITSETLSDNRYIQPFIHAHGDRIVRQV